MSKLDSLLFALEQAKKAAEVELLRMYPIGQEVRFTIQPGQKNASTGTVLRACWRDGYLRVRHHEAKPFSRYSARSVHHSQILV